MATNAVAKTWRVARTATGWTTLSPVDTLAPTVPIIQSAVSESSSTITLTFSKSIDAQSGVREYVIRKRLSGVGSYIEHARVQDTGAVSYSPVMTALSPSTAYQFVAAAVDNAGNVSSDSAAVAVTTLAGAALTFAPDPPRLGRYNIGNPQTYTLSWAPRYGRKDVDIVNADYPTWATGRGYTREAFVRAYKDASTRQFGTKIFQYANCNEQLPPGGLGTNTGPSHPDYYARIEAINAWLYNLGSSGAKTPSNFNAAYQLIDYYADASIYPWFGDYWVKQFIEGVFNPANAAPSLDGVFVDNLLIDPQVNGDWNRDNTTDTSVQMRSRSWLPEGQKRLMDTIRARWPGKMVGGNIADYGRYTASQGPNAGQWEVGLYESAMGMSYSTYTWGSAAAMMQTYQNLHDFLKAPKILVFGARTPNPQDYEWARNCICAGMMGDGYISVQPSAKIGTVVPYSSNPADWVEYDEFYGGVLDRDHYLGPWIDPPQYKPIFNIEAGNTGGGTYRRRATNGEVWWNSRRGTGPIASSSTTAYPSVAIGRTVRALSGVLDTTVNNGATGITTFPSLPPDRGRVYLY